MLTFGPSVGRYDGRDIPGWFQDGEAVYDFEGLSGKVVDLSRLDDDQVVMAPGLLYRRRAAGTQTPPAHKEERLLPVF